jgi:hypothetical protein
MFTDLFAPHAAAYPAAYAKLARGETITCATTGTTFKALPAPAALIADVSCSPYGVSCRK